MSLGMEQVDMRKLAPAAQEERQYEGRRASGERHHGADVARLGP